jgi:hypothetical protein
MDVDGHTSNLSFCGTLNIGAKYRGEVHTALLFVAMTTSVPVNPFFGNFNLFPRYTVVLPAGVGTAKIKSLGENYALPTDCML